MWVDSEIKRAMDRAARSDERATFWGRLICIGIALFCLSKLTPEQPKPTPAVTPAVQPVVPAVQPKPVQQYRT